MTSFRARHALTAIAVAAGALLTQQAMAAPITQVLNVNVYQLCDDAGANCASLGNAGNFYFEAETDKIYAQAGIDVNFTFVQTINSSHFLYIDDSVANRGLDDLTAAYGAAGMYNHGFVDMFLVKTVAGAYGEGWLGAGGLVLAMDTIMSFNSGAGRLDTVAHELGHNLGLEPNSLGGVNGHSTDPYNLMASGSIRYSPASINDIAPGGLGYDQLTTGQINLIKGSDLLQPVPEPETYAMLLAGLGVLGAVKRRQQRRAG